MQRMNSHQKLCTALMDTLWEQVAGDKRLFKVKDDLNGGVMGLSDMADFYDESECIIAVETVLAAEKLQQGETVTIKSSGWIIRRLS